jgi:hypothetical protein
MRRGRRDDSQVGFRSIWRPLCGEDLFDGLLGDPRPPLGHGAPRHYLPGGRPAQHPGAAARDALGTCLPCLLRGRSGRPPVRPNRRLRAPEAHPLPHHGGGGVARLPGGDHRHPRVAAGPGDTFQDPHQSGRHHRRGGPVLRRGAEQLYELSARFRNHRYGR